MSDQENITMNDDDSSDGDDDVEMIDVVTISDVEDDGVEMLDSSYHDFNQSGEGTEKSDKVISLSF